MELGSNKSRKDTRAVVSLVARYRSPSTFEYVQEACCDVSVGGMFIQSQDPAPAGTLLKLECGSDHEAAQIRGVARVVWLRREPNEYGPRGMGVKFVKLEPGSKEAIMRVVQELAAAGVTPASISTAPESTGELRTNRSDGAGLISRGSKQIATWVPGAGAKPLASSGTRLSQARENLRRSDEANAGPGLSVSQVRSVSSRPPPRSVPAPAGKKTASELAMARNRIAWLTGGAFCLALAVVIGFAARRQSTESTTRPERAAKEPAARSANAPVTADTAAAPAPSATSGSQPPQLGDSTAPSATALANAEPPAAQPPADIADVKAAAQADRPVGAALSGPSSGADATAATTTPAAASNPASSSRTGASTTAQNARDTAEPPAITITPTHESDEPSAPGVGTGPKGTETAASATPGASTTPAPSVISQPAAAPAAARPATPQTPGSPSAPATATATRPTTTAAPSASAASGVSAQPVAPQARAVPTSDESAAAKPATLTGTPAAPATVRTTTTPAAQAAKPATAAVSTAPAATSAAVATTSSAQTARASAPANTATAAAAAPHQGAAAHPPTVTGNAVQAARAPAPTSTSNATAPGATPAMRAATPAPPPSSTATSPAPSRPALPAGQLPYIVTFITRPTGATVTVRDQTVVAPGDMNLGAMPLHVLVTAQKEGFEPSSVWLERVEFIPSSDGLRRRVYLTLPPLPAGSANKPASAPTAAIKAQ